RPVAHTRRPRRGGHRLPPRARDARDLDRTAGADARRRARALPAAPDLHRTRRHATRARGLLRALASRRLRAPDRAPARAHARGPESRPVEALARRARESLGRIPALRGPRARARRVAAGCRRARIALAPEAS